MTEPPKPPELLHYATPKTNRAGVVRRQIASCVISFLVLVAAIAIVPVFHFGWPAPLLVVAVLTSIAEFSRQSPEDRGVASGIYAGMGFAMLCFAGLAWIAITL